jgi:AsmA protein
VQASAGGLRPELTGNLSLRGATLQTQKLNLLLGEDRALLDLTAENLYGKPVRINSTLVADRLQLDALFGGRSKEGSKKDTRSDAAGKSVKKVLGPYKLPLYATGTMRVGQALWRGLLIEDLSARYQLRDNIFTLEQLTGKTAGGTFSETARVDLTVPGLAYKTRIETNAIQADPMLSVLAPKMSGTVFGLLNLKVDMQGRGTGAEDLKQNLSGNGDLVIADGKITGAGLVAGLADFLDLEELRVLRFTRAASQLTVKDGRVQVDGNLAGEQVRLAPTGSVGLDGTLDIGLPLRLAPTLTARLAGQNKFSRFLTDSQGWGALPLKVTGTVKAPRFALDTSTLGGTIRRGVQDQLQKTLQEKLLGPRDGSAQPKGTGDAPAEGSPEDSKTDKKSKEEQLLEGVMKGLFGK